MVPIKLRIVILFFVIVLSFWYVGLPAKIAEIQDLKKTLTKLQPAKKIHKKNIPAPLITKDPRPPEEIFDALIKMIQQAGFEVQALQWLKSETRNGLQATTISLKISGDFSRYIFLIPHLLTFSLPIIFQSFDRDESESISIQCTIWHVKNTLTKTSSANLQNTPLNQLKSVGFLQSAQRTWGFIEMPNGEMHRVAVRDVIGAEKAEIIKITAHSIVVADGKLRKII